MSGKSRHSHKKHSFQSKRRKGRPSPPAIVTQQQAVTQADETVSPPKAFVPPARTPIPSALTTVQYPYILTELRRIGILAGIILAILIVLALVFS